MALLSQLSSSHFVRHRESWLPAQAPQLKFNLLTECMWNSFVGHVTVVLPPEKTPLLAKTYLLFERGAAEEPAASSTRPWPSSVDGLLAFYCWKLLTAGRCLLLLEALLLRRLCLRLCPMVYCVLNSVAFVACLHKLRVPRRPHSFTSLRLRLIVRVSIIYVRYVVVFIDEPCLGEAFFGFKRVCF